MSIPPSSQDYVRETGEVRAACDYNVQVEYHSCLHALILYFTLYFTSLLCFLELHTYSVATPLASGLSGHI